MKKLAMRCLLTSGAIIDDHSLVNLTGGRMAVAKYGDQQSRLVHGVPNTWHHRYPMRLLRINYAGLQVAMNLCPTKGGDWM